MGVRMAADVHKQCRVIHHRALTIIKTGTPGESQRDQALAQHMLHGLPETEVDAQGQGGHQLGQAHLPAAAGAVPDHRAQATPDRDPGDKADDATVQGATDLWPSAVGLGIGAWANRPPS